MKEAQNKAVIMKKTEKDFEIDRQNKILLNKLVEISSGKQSQLSAPPKKKKKTAPKKSLNFDQRK